ncbi:hypothetical protein ACTFIU_000877 [Dictyostelium citrinum]
MNNNNNNNKKIIKINKIDNELKCQICFNYLNDPVKEKQCGKIFCRGCLNSSDTCPTCKTTTTITTATTSIVNMIEISKNEFTDRFNDITIVCDECDDVIPIKRCNNFMEYHLKNDCKTQLCSLGCGELFKKTDINNHILNQCESSLINCKGKNVNCTFSSIRSLVSIHEITCPYVLLQSMLINLIESNKEKDLKINKLENDLHLVNQKLQQLEIQLKQIQPQQPQQPQQSPLKINQLFSKPMFIQPTIPDTNKISGPQLEPPPGLSQFTMDFLNNKNSKNYTEPKSIGEFDNEFSKRSLVMVFLSTLWCDKCKECEKVLKIYAESQQQIMFIKVDLEKLSNIEVCKNVSGVPCFVTYKNGEKIDSYLGSNKSNIRKLVEDLSLF